MGGSGTEPGWEKTERREKERQENERTGGGEERERKEKGRELRKKEWMKEKKKEKNISSSDYIYSVLRKLSYILANGSLEFITYCI